MAMNESLTNSWYCTTVSTVVVHFCSGACALFSPPCEIPSRQSIWHQFFL